MGSSEEGLFSVLGPPFGLFGRNLRDDVTLREVAQENKNTVYLNARASCFKGSRLVFLPEALSFGPLPPPRRPPHPPLPHSFSGNVRQIFLLLPLFFLFFLILLALHTTFKTIIGIGRQDQCRPGSEQEGI